MARTIRYRRNPVRKNMYSGRKVRDDITGFWSYEDRMAKDEEGNRYDPTRTQADNVDWKQSRVNLVYDTT